MNAIQQCLQLLIFILIAWKINISSAEIRVVCYYTNWSVYRPGTAKFNPQNINPYLCTHLIYAFGGFTKESNFKPFDKYQDIEKGGYAKFTGLKTYNKNLKTMLAIGGWNEGSSRFSPMVASAEKRKEFVKNSVKFLRQNHFDGLDLDWEYPAFRDGGKPRDRDNYASLVQELREEYERESEKTGRPRLLVTMAVPAGIEYINKGYDIPKLMKYLDWMNILSYDYHSAFEPAVNHHSPLYGLEEASEYNYDSDLNINHTIHHYLNEGAISDKLVLGIPTYGRSYTLFNPDATDIGAPADGPGEMGDATRENGYLAYYEICEKLKSDDEWIVEQPNANAMGPYAYKDNQWVGYDDESIVRKKSEFVAKMKLGGIMFWSIDNDDFRGNCNGKPYPLIEAAKEALMEASGYVVDNVIPAPDKISRKRKRPTSAPAVEEEAQTVSAKKRYRGNKKQDNVAANDEVTESISKTRRIRIQNNRRRSSTTTTTTSSPGLTKYNTPEPPTTPDPGGDFKCEDEGFYPHPRDCKKYFWCLSSGPSELGIVAHQFTCPSGLYFNKAADSCDYTQNVLCNKKKAKETTTKATTTTKTTTEASLPSISFTTKRAPPKITAATSKTTVVVSSTTEDYQEEYEYEDEEEIDDGLPASEEDPKVIKELLDLIKKAGGIEELEKQLHFYDNNATSVTASGSTTPRSFSKSLYQRVLNRTVAKNKESSFRTNNSGGQQFHGSAKSEDTSSKRGRPQYTAISRQRPSTEKSLNNENLEEEIHEKKQPEYHTILRTRSTTAGPDDFESDPIDEDEEEKAVVVTSKTPEYVTLRRRRPTTEEPTSKYVQVRSKSSTVNEETSTAASHVVANENTYNDNKDDLYHRFKTIPGEELSGVVKQEATSQISTLATEHKSEIITTTEAAKVSETISSRNFPRFRFSTQVPTNTENKQTNRFKNRFVENEKVNLNEEATINPNGGTQEIKNRRRGSSRYSQRVQIDGGGEYDYNDGSYDAKLYQERKFRPDISAEISDLSSLTSADFSERGTSQRRTHRRPTSTQRSTTNFKSRNAQDAKLPSISEGEETVGGGNKLFRKNVTVQETEKRRFGTNATIVSETVTKRNLYKRIRPIQIGLEQEDSQSESAQQVVTRSDETGDFQKRFRPTQPTLNEANSVSNRFKFLRPINANFSSSGLTKNLTQNRQNSTNLDLNNDEINSKNSTLTPSTNSETTEPSFLILEANSHSYLHQTKNSSFRNENSVVETLIKSKPNDLDQNLAKELNNEFYGSTNGSTNSEEGSIQTSTVQQDQGVALSQTAAENNSSSSNLTRNVKDEGQNYTVKPFRGRGFRPVQIPEVEDTPIHVIKTLRGRGSRPTTATVEENIGESQAASFKYRGIKQTQTDKIENEQKQNQTIKSRGSKPFKTIFNEDVQNQTIETFRSRGVKPTQSVETTDDLESRKVVRGRRVRPTQTVDDTEEQKDRATETFKSRVVRPTHTVDDTEEQKYRTTETFRSRGIKPTQTVDDAEEQKNRTIETFTSRGVKPTQTVDDAEEQKNRTIETFTSRGVKPTQTGDDTQEQKYRTTDTFRSRGVRPTQAIISEEDSEEQVTKQKLNLTTVGYTDSGAFRTRRIKPAQTSSEENDSGENIENNKTEIRDSYNGTTLTDTEEEQITTFAADDSSNEENSNSVTTSYTRENSTQTVLSEDSLAANVTNVNESQILSNQTVSEGEIEIESEINVTLALGATTENSINSTGTAAPDNSSQVIGSGSRNTQGYRRRIIKPTQSSDSIADTSQEILDDSKANPNRNNTRFRGRRIKPTGINNSSTVESQTNTEITKTGSQGNSGFKTRRIRPGKTTLASSDVQLDLLQNTTSSGSANVNNRSRLNVIKGRRISPTKSSLESTQNGVLGQSNSSTLKIKRVKLIKTGAPSSTTPQEVEDATDAEDSTTTSEDDDENINLSESNIREKSQNHINALDEKTILVKDELESDKVSQIQITESDRNKTAGIGNLPVIKRRRIFKKISTTEPSTTTTKGRTRKIIRRLRTTTPSVSLAETTSETSNLKQTTRVEDDQTVKYESTTDQEYLTEITTEGDFTTIDESEEETKIIATTPKVTTTPFYYKGKLSRPPFLINRNRQTTEVIEPSSTASTVRHYSRNNIYQKYKASKTTPLPSTTTAAPIETDIATIFDEAITTLLDDETSSLVTEESDITTANTDAGDDITTTEYDLNQTNDSSTNQKIVEDLSTFVKELGKLIKDYKEDTDLLSENQSERTNRGKSLGNAVQTPEENKTKGVPKGIFQRPKFVPRVKPTGQSSIESKLEVEDETNKNVTSETKEKSGLRGTFQRPKFIPRKPTSATGIERPSLQRSQFYQKSTTVRPTSSKKFEDIAAEFQDNQEEEGEQEEEYYEQENSEELDSENEAVDYSKPKNTPQFVPKFSRVDSSTKKTIGKFSNKISTRKEANNPAEVHENLEVKKLRNSLFSKTRKANTPYPGVQQTSVSTKGTTQEELAGTTSFEEESTTSYFSKNTETTEQQVTLHHVFAETETPVPITTEPSTNSTNKVSGKKLERLIEVNRIVEVSEGVHNSVLENELTGPVLDRIGAINRVTVIKVVDPVDGFNVTTNSSNLESSSNKTVNGSSLAKFYGNGKLIRYGTNLEAYLYSAKSKEQDLDKPRIPQIQIFGKSAVNKYTPATSKPIFNTEASTIALEALFTPTHKEESNDELLETQNANLVKIKVLNPEELETSPHFEIHDGSKAEVVEVTPAKNSKFIKIAPITLSFNNAEAKKIRFPSRTRRPIIRSTTLRYKPTVSTTSSSRTRKPIKRKLFTTKKPQEATTQSSRNISRFPSRKPFLRLTTIKNLERAIKNYNTDQALQPTNQRDLEKEKVFDDTTTLSEFASALNQLQQASVRTNRNFSRNYPPSNVYNLGSSTHRPLNLLSTVYIPTTTMTPTVFQISLPQVQQVQQVQQMQQDYPTKTYIIKPQRPRPFEKFAPQIYNNGNKNYDYYDDITPSRYVPQNSKVLIHASGLLQCLDQGNFPHPASCKKFIYCAKVDTGDILGWEYTCAKNLSFDPVGGICNWSAGLGCHE